MLKEIDLITSDRGVGGGVVVCRVRTSRIYLHSLIILMERKNGETLGCLACHLAATARRKQVPACVRNIV